MVGVCLSVWAMPSKIAAAAAAPLLTVGIPVGSDVLWRAGQVEDDQLGFVRLVDDDLVEADSRVHPAHVGRLVSAKGRVEVRREGVGTGEEGVRSRKEASQSIFLS